MRTSYTVSTLAVWASLLLGGQSRLVNDPPVDEEELRSHGGTNRFIIEIEPTFATARVGNSLRKSHSEEHPYYREFDCSDVFAGIAIETDTDNADTLRAIEGVVNVWPLKTVPVIPIIETSSDEAPTDMRNWSIHRWTGVDKLHEKGIRGKGATVAIIDTGIDWTHEALGGCFGPGCKVRGGYDLVGTDWDPYDEWHYPKRPDDDPMDFYGHGTHVAGIIAGDHDWFTGVAPDADLLIFKVFADNPWDTDEEALLQGFCDAYSAGADVISASIGRPGGFVDNPWALVASRLVDKGVVVTISAGNEGSTGPFYTSTGSNGHGVLSVAAINVTGDPNITMADESARPVAAYFTSWGPTAELLLKPDIGAPGYEIVSTILNQDYDTMSGTSMAAPYIAGVAALYIGEHGGREVHGPGLAKMLWERIVSSGKNVAWSADRVRMNRNAPPFQVGTGLVDAWKVVQYDTQLGFESFALGDTQHFEPRWTVNITNHGNTTLNYTFWVDEAPATEIYNKVTGVAALYHLEPYWRLSMSPEITLPEPIRLRPGASREVEFEFEIPRIIDDDYLPLYGGKVRVNASNGERLSIAYGGAAYDTEKAFDTMFSGEPYIAGTNWGLDWSWSFNTERDPLDYISLSARLAYPCDHLRWDIYKGEWNEVYWQYPPADSFYYYIGSATTMRNADVHYYFDPDTMDKNDTIPFPLTRVPRGYQQYWWFGKLADGSQIEPGNYSIRFAALRPYGNPEISDHWDVMPMEVETFQVLPYNGTRNATRPEFHWKLHR